MIGAPARPVNANQGIYATTLHPRGAWGTLITFPHDPRGVPMARMSREFNLVLLGAGLLTAGSFLWPDPDPVKRAEEEENRNGGGGRSRTRTTHVFFVTTYTR